MFSQHPLYKKNSNFPSYLFLFTFQSWPEMSNKAGLFVGGNDAYFCVECASVNRMLSLPCQRLITRSLDIYETSHRSKERTNINMFVKLASTQYYKCLAHLQEHLETTFGKSWRGWDDHIIIEFTISNWKCPVMFENKTHRSTVLWMYYWLMINVTKNDVSYLYFT